MPKYKLAIRPSGDTLLVVDVETTFMPGGSLPVAEGDLIVPVVFDIVDQFPVENRIATLDKHYLGSICLASSYANLGEYTEIFPVDIKDWQEDDGNLTVHARFSVAQLKAYLQVCGRQMLWPDHGLVGTAESRLHPQLAQMDFGLIIKKGLDLACDSYSAIKDNLGRPTGLADYLRVIGTKRVFVVGLAFDYCVGFTALDAAAEGFEVVVLTDATKSVSEVSEAEMKERLCKRNIQMLAI